jgi:hypothetical protein
MVSEGELRTPFEYRTCPRAACRFESVICTVGIAVAEGVVGVEAAVLTVGIIGLLFRAQAMGNIVASARQMALKICFFMIFSI